MMLQANHLQRLNGNNNKISEANPLLIFILDKKRTLSYVFAKNVRFILTNDSVDLNIVRVLNRITYNFVE